MLYGCDWLGVRVTSPIHSFHTSAVLTAYRGYQRPHQLAYEELLHSEQSLPRLIRKTSRMGTDVSCVLPLPWQP